VEESTPLPSPPASPQHVTLSRFPPYEGTLCVMHLPGMPRPCYACAWEQRCPQRQTHTLSGAPLTRMLHHATIDGVNSEHGGIR